MSVFPNAVLKMVIGPNPSYYCQDCKYFEQEGYWFPNSDDTDDLFMCTWCFDNQWEELYHEGPEDAIDWEQITRDDTRAINDVWR